MFRRLTLVLVVHGWLFFRLISVQGAHGALDGLLKVVVAVRR